MEQKPKEHFLRTIQDVYNVIDDKNIDFFLEDFRMFAVDCVKAKLLNRLACEMSGEKEQPLTLEHFHWIEDGKHESHGTFISTDDDSIRFDVNKIIDKISNERDPSRKIPDSDIKYFKKRESK